LTAANNLPVDTPPFPLNTTFKYNSFPEWGWYGTEFAVTLALGGKVPYIFDIRPRTMYQDNADLFYPKPALEPINWDLIKTGGSPRVK